jgi:hypothetical protein
MRGMEHHAASQPVAADPLEVGRHHARAGAGRDETDRPQIRSLITPGVASGPILPESVRKRFRRKEKHR